jgi:hypothetical protein
VLAGVTDAERFLDSTQNIDPTEVTVFMRAIDTALRANEMYAVNAD